MKLIFVIAFFGLLLGGCRTASQAPSTPPPVSTAGVERGIDQAGTAVDAAESATERASERVRNARTYADRIDAKTVVILEYWDRAQ